MSLRTITTITFLLSVATLSIKATQYPGCVSVATGNGGGLCTACYKRKVLDNGKGCGPLDPGSDRCLIHQKYPIDENNTCGLCKPGFSNSHTVSNTTHTSCVKGVIQDCAFELQSGVGSPVCDACFNGKYAVLSDRTQRYSCQKVPNPLPNCVLGGTYNPATRSARCYRCSQGFASSIADGKCHPFKEGCLSSIGPNCLECDFYAGYSMDSNGKCFKTSLNALEYY